MGPYELLEKIINVFETLHIQYLVTGSVASMAYGEPRLTNDIDIVAGVEEHHIAGLLNAFPSNEFYISEDMIRQAINRKSQFNIIHPASGLKVGFWEVGVTGIWDGKKNGWERIKYETRRGRKEIYFAFTQP